MHNAGLELPVVAESSMASFGLFSRIFYREVLLCEVRHKFWCSSLKEILWLWFMFLQYICLPSPGTTLSAVFEKETEIN
jgi:hypothetical protein